MICDIGGFAASCFQRGIRFAHVPTSLLAMADAAIGGKSGVNFEGYKNYIGQIEAPIFTWIDPSFLATLPKIEMINGFAEIIKHAIIASPPLWELISKYEDLESVDWTSILTENTPVKQKITDADPDEKGLRKILNFGHTIGHALESFFMPNDHPMSHGQAVTLGMLAESRIANQMGLLNEADFIRITSLISRLLSPSPVPLPPMDAFRGWLAGDKKKVSGQVGYSLPEGIGSCRWNMIVEDQYLQESMNWLTTHLKTYSGRLSMES
jgi:3-dehydroquinate synthase